jgi:hypothetical protein
VLFNIVKFFYILFVITAFGGQHHLRRLAVPWQIEALERYGAQSAAYRSANRRATIDGIGVMVPILASLLMVTKPSL